MADPRVIDPTRPEEWQADLGGAPAPVPIMDVKGQDEALARAIENLAAAGRKDKIIRPVSTVAQGNTNSSGTLTLAVYQAGAGFYFYGSRLIVEAATFDATNPRTPASPFTSANTFWCGAFVSANPNDVDQGQLVDFFPTTAAGQGLPAVAEYAQGADGITSGPFLRSGEWLVLYFVSGPTSQRISARLQGNLVGAEV